MHWPDYYTDVGEAKRFVEETGVDYLAISVGIVHGVIPGLKPEPLAIERTLEIRDAVGIPLVLHGASGIPENEVLAACAAGVHKFNADTDLRHAFRAGIEAVWAKGDYQLEGAMAEGRTRIPIESGQEGIHSISAAAIDQVNISAGEKRAVRIEIELNNSAGIFQVDDLLATKIRDTPIADDIEVVAEVSGESEKRLLTGFRLPG